VVSQSNINSTISQPTIPVSVHNSNPEKVTLNNYNIFIRRRDKLDKSKITHITVNLLCLSDKKSINIEIKDLDFTIFINKICCYKYIYFDGARDKLEWERRERILEFSLSQLS